MNPIYNINVEEDTDLNLTIQFSHSIIKTQWFMNDTPIEKLSLNYRNYMENDQAFLIIHNVSKRYYDRYRVEAWDILNQTNQSIIFIHVYSLRKNIELKTRLYNLSYWYYTSLCSATDYKLFLWKQSHDIEDIYIV